MATNYALRFTKDIPGTKDVICPAVEVVYTQTFDESAEERAIYDYFQKNAMKRVMKVAENAIKPFQPAIKDAQKKIDDIRKKTKNLKTEKDWNDLRDNLKQLKTFTETAAKLLEQGVSTVQSMIMTELEKVETDAVAYVKKKLKRDLTKRKWKKGLKVVLLGTLTIAVAAAGIAATIATAGTGLAAVVGVLSIAATVWSTYQTVSKAVEDDWENEKRTIARIGAFYENLHKITENLDEQLKALEAHRNKRLKSLQKAQQTLDDLAKKQKEMPSDAPDQKKLKSEIEAKLKEADATYKKLDAIDKEIVDLLKMGQQTRQYLGPLANAKKAASSTSQSMKDGTKFIIDQTNAAVTIRDNLKNFSGGSGAGSKIVSECSKILNSF